MLALPVLPVLLLPGLCCRWQEVCPSACSAGTCMAHVRHLACRFAGASGMRARRCCRCCAAQMKWMQSMLICECIWDDFACPLHPPACWPCLHTLHVHACCPADACSASPSLMTRSCDAAQQAAKVSPLQVGGQPQQDLAASLHAQTACPRCATLPLAPASLPHLTPPPPAPHASFSTAPSPL